MKIKIVFPFPVKQIDDNTVETESTVLKSAPVLSTEALRLAQQLLGERDSDLMEQEVVEYYNTQLIRRSIVIIK